MPDKFPVTSRQHRPAAAGIPPTELLRRELAHTVRRYAADEKPVGPLPVEQLKKHCLRIIGRFGIDSGYINFIAVLLNNMLWRDTVAAVPYNRRLLLLPKCLRSEHCKGELDEIGLICRHCGSCVIDEFTSQAEQLGYAVLVAEGSPVVMSLIESGRIEAVIGVSCLNVLENIFPYMEAGAIAGIAVPLINDGCSDTSVDTDWVWEAIYLAGDDTAGGFSVGALKERMAKWFSRESLSDIVDAGRGHVAAVALDWLALAGKRWRPFLAAAIYQSCAGKDNSVADSTLRDVCVAVECFHKASLIHDDIEDGDTERYGAKTLHAEHGVPIAINVGDFLLGLGYRLLAGAEVSNQRRVKMLAAASEAHLQLCTGQGQELAALKTGKPLEVKKVLEIFEKKTAPAFEVALRVGAILAGADEELKSVLKNFSCAVGIAYQIRDDMEDWQYGGEEDSSPITRPSIIPAIGYERADRLMDTYRTSAMDCLAGLKNMSLKILLRRIVGRIFDDFELLGCCDEYKAGFTKGRSKGG